MRAVFESQQLTKRFGAMTALDRVSLSVPEHSIVGLIGPNGSGKTTLLHHVTGLYLPSQGSCATFGTPGSKLGRSELARMGVVQQQGRFLQWMTVGQQLRYFSSFYDTWDSRLQERLLRDLELDIGSKVINLSPGNAQKLSLLLAVCHRPDLLLLDEPVSALDPLARRQLFEFLFELLADRPLTILISSHVLRDIERLVDRVACLASGQLTADAPLDELQERYAEWHLRSSSQIPGNFEEPYVLEQQVNSRQARLIVRDAQPFEAEFAARHRVELTSRPLNLEAIYPFLLQKEKR